jgi:phosphatidylserine/phosphatidylglycerophosphate/cardiolipin synthase-like enzyme
MYSIFRVMILWILAALTGTSVMSQQSRGFLVSRDLPPILREDYNKSGKKNEFEITYNRLVEYYFHVGHTLGDQFIFTENSEIGKPKHKLGKSTPNQMPEYKYDLKFKVDLNKMVIRPSVPLDPEYVQQLFNFDMNRYISAICGGQCGTLAEAKLKYFNEKQLGINFLTQYYDRNYLYLEDWHSLPHPPLRNQKKLNLLVDLKSTQSVAAPYSTKLNIIGVELNKQLDRETDSELTSGNVLTLLRNGLSYNRKFEVVRAAKKSILAAVMSFAADPSSKKLIKEMGAAVKRGVDVKVILEKAYSTTAFKPALELMYENGIQVVLADDFAKSLSSTNPLKNDLMDFSEYSGLFHNKFWIIDGSIGILGGQNIVNSGNISTGYNHKNVDTDLEIHGPLVTDMTHEFIRLVKRYNPTRDMGIYETQVQQQKTQQKNAKVRGQDNYAVMLNEKNILNTQKSAGVCRMVIQGPQKKQHHLSLAFAKYIENAKKHVVITSPDVEFDNPEVLPLYEQMSYLPSDPDINSVYSALFEKANAGVRVDMISNGIDGGFAEIGQNIAEGKNAEDAMFNDPNILSEPNWKQKLIQKILDPNELGKKAAQRVAPYYVRIHENKVNLWLHFQYMHSKTLLVDNALASVGSYNLNPFSSDSSHESAVLCFDQSLVNQLRSDMILNIANSTPYKVPYNLPR